MSTTPSNARLPAGGTRMFIPEVFAALETANMLQKAVYKGDGFTYTCSAFPGSGALSDSVWLIRRVTDATGVVMFPQSNGSCLAAPAWAATSLEVVAAYTYGYKSGASVDDDTLAATAAANDYDVALTILGWWTATSDKDFVTIETPEGKGSASVTLDVAVNTTGLERVAEVTFANTAGQSVVVTVTQAASDE